MHFNKKGKDLTKNKYIKVRNPIASSKLWDVFSSIEAHSLAFFADAIKILLECDQRLPLNRLIYFEDCVIFFDYFFDCVIFFVTKVTEDFGCLSIVK